MESKLKKITAIIISVIFLTGIIPFSLTKLFDPGKKQPYNVRVLLPENKIKEIPLEEYLVGVVAAEMPAEFEAEALKAQAVASRTYVLKRIEENASKQNSYDVDTTEKTQAWNSNTKMLRKWGLIDYWKYRRKITRAVEETRGKVLVFKGQKIDAVYHSSCGRRNTERASDVWGTEISYLTNVASGEKEPYRFVKHQIYDIDKFYKLLGFIQITPGIDENDIKVLERTRAGRIKTLLVRNKIYQGTDFRARLHLPSTDFEWKIEPGKVEFTVYGNGHGVGMSQYGANDLAKEGKNYEDILAHYYPGTKLAEI